MSVNIKGKDAGANQTLTHLSDWKAASNMYPTKRESGFCGQIQGRSMATIALDPLLVAKINALLASMQSREEQEQFSTEDILELFETFLVEQSQRPHTSKELVVRRTQPVTEPM